MFLLLSQFHGSPSLRKGRECAERAAGPEFLPATPRRRPAPFGPGPQRIPALLGAIPHTTGLNPPAGEFPEQLQQQSEAGVLPGDGAFADLRTSQLGVLSSLGRLVHFAHPLNECWANLSTTRVA